MAYSSDRKPLELTELTALAADDTIIVGDTSDTSEVAKYITKTNLTTTLGIGGGDFLADGSVPMTGDLDLGDQDLNNAKSIVFKTDESAPAHAEGTMFYDQDTKTFGLYNDEADVTLSVGEEQWLRVINNTGSTVTNGQAVYIVSASGGLPTIELTDASLFATSDTVIGVATHDIENGTEGIITTFGLVRGLDTSSFSAGDSLYISTTEGAITNTPPAFPNYTIHIGHCVVSHATTGELLVNISGSAFDIIHNFQNGSVLNSIDLDVTSDGATVTASIERNGGGDITAIFSDGFHEIDTTPAVTVALTPGTDTAPVENFLYIPSTTDTLTANTSGFPNGIEYAPVGTVFCQSATGVQTDGPYKVHAWTDHIASDSNNGHMAHINSWIRAQPATWKSGVSLTPTTATNTFDIATTVGTILQLHDHTMPVFDTSTGSDVFLINDPTTPYEKRGDLTSIIQDANGDTLGGGASDFYNLVIWGVVSEDEADCKLMVNLPDGSYGNNNGDKAINDNDNTAVYTIPTEYAGTGFLIARLTVQNNGTAYAILQNEDLRGKFPSTQAGGGTGGGGATTFLELTDTDASYSGEAGKVPVVNVGETGLEFEAVLQDLVEDTTPQLGGELDAQANSIGFTMQSATGDGTTTIDWGNGNHFDFTFGAQNDVFTFTAPAKSGVYTLTLKQDSVGSRTATFPASVKWAGGTAPTLTTTATTGYDIISFRFDGTNYYGVASLDFS